MTFTATSGTTVENICKIGVFGCKETELSHWAESNTTTTFDLLADTARYLALPPIDGTCPYYVSQISEMFRLTDDLDMISDVDYSSVFTIDDSAQFLKISLPAWTS